MKVGVTGRPTQPDVKLIIDKYPSMKPGDEVLYEEVEKIIQTPRNSTRFKTVTNAWRKRMDREHDIFIGVIPNKGFVVEVPSESVYDTKRGIRSGLRRITKSGSKAARINRKQLSAEESRTADHVIAVSAKLVEVHNADVRRARALEDKKGR